MYILVKKYLSTAFIIPHFHYVRNDQAADKWLFYSDVPQRQEGRFITGWLILWSIFPFTN